jgi:hypothetical protein
MKEEEEEKKKERLIDNKTKKTGLRPCLVQEITEVGQ